MKNKLKPNDLKFVAYFSWNYWIKRLLFSLL